MNLAKIDMPDNTIYYINNASISRKNDEEYYYADIYFGSSAAIGRHPIRFEFISAQI